MAHSYSHLYRLPVTGLRLFTIYGPWGRPDMAYFLFTKAILEGRPVDVYSRGEMMRDFTYVDDIVECVSRCIFKPPAPDPGWSGSAPDPGSSCAPYRLYNIGNNNAVSLSHFISVIEKCLGRTAVRNLLPPQPGDMPATAADITDLVRDMGFRPSTSIEQGLRRFIDWYREYYRC
jgi:UDP-glucuronate 4-epimerase